MATYLKKALPEEATLQSVLTTTAVGDEQRRELSSEWAQAEAADELDDEEAEYTIIEDELYSLRQPYAGASPYPRLMAPASLQPRLLREAHEETGHRGLFSLLRRLQAFAVWKGMKGAAKRFLRSCPHCQGNRRNPVATRPQHTDTPTRPFEKVGIDMTGPFLPSLKGNKYLLNVVDHLTGWAECFPVPDKKATTVWTTLEKELFPRHGHPTILVTDSGAEFANQIFREGCRKLHIQHRQATPYHPQTNGVVERFHRTLKECLRKLVNNTTATWEDQLARALWAYRISDSQARGSSPFALLYGREPDRHDVINPDGEPHAAQRFAYEKMEEAKSKRIEKSRGQGLACRQLEIGDMMTISAPEPVTLAHLRDHAYRVVELRGKVVSYTKPLSNQPHKIWRVHIDRVQRVPEDITWDDVRPRPHRSRHGPDVRTLTGPTITPPVITLPPRDALSQPPPQPQKKRRRRRARYQLQAKRARCRDSSETSGEEGPTPAPAERATPAPPQSAATPYQGPITRSRDLTEPPIRRLNGSPPSPPNQRGCSSRV